MVRIDFKDGRITVVLSGNKKTKYSKELKKGDSQDTIERMVKNALESAAFDYSDNNKLKEEAEKASKDVAGIKKWASDIKNQLEGVKTPEKKEEKPVPKAEVKKAPKAEEKKPIVKAPEKPAEKFAKMQESADKIAKSVGAETPKKAKPAKELAREMRQAMAAKAKALKEEMRKAKLEIAAKAKEEKKRIEAERKAHKIMPTKPQPVRDVGFVIKQFGEIQKGGDRMEAAVRSLHANSAFIGEYLSGSGRTEAQKATTIAVFNELWQIPKFGNILFQLSKPTTPEKPDVMKGFPNLKEEFRALNTYLQSSSNKTKMLNASAESDIIEAADKYVRYYLLAFSAKTNKGLHEEIDQLPGLSGRLKNIDFIDKYETTPVKEGGPSPKEKTLTINIQGDMDPGTVTAAALYRRRWILTHPESGEEVKQDDLKVWKAPQVIAPQEEAKAGEKPAEQKAEAPKEKSALEKFAEQKWRSLKNDLFVDATKGNPNAMILLFKTEVPGKISMEVALKNLGRDDIDRATDQAFNEYFKKNQSFMDFCRANRQYVGITNRSTALSPETPADGRRTIIRAIEDFINRESSRTDAKWYGRLGNDLGFLYNKVLELKRDTLDVSGVSDMRLLSAIGVYTWREKNKDAQVGAYAANIKGVEAPEAKKPEEPAKQPEKPKIRTMRLVGPE